MPAARRHVIGAAFRLRRRQAGARSDQADDQANQIDESCMLLSPFTTAADGTGWTNWSITQRFL